MLLCNRNSTLYVHETTTINKQIKARTIITICYWKCHVTYTFRVKMNSFFLTSKMIKSVLTLKKHVMRQYVLFTVVIFCSPTWWYLKAICQNVRVAVNYAYFLINVQSTCLPNTVHSHLYNLLSNVYLSFISSFLWISNFPCLNHIFSQHQLRKGQ